MKYPEVKKTMEKMMQDNYPDFIKALISLENGVNDNKQLDKIYEVYMQADDISLLNPDFDYLLDKL